MGELARPEDYLPPAADAHGTPDQVEALLRASQVARLRAMGLTWAKIAEELGYADGAGPRQLLERYAHRALTENVEAARATWNETHRLQLASMMTIMRDTKTTPEQRMRASAEITRIGARAARLNGYDAPVRVEVSDAARAQVEQALGLLEDTVLGLVTDVVDEPIEEREEA